MINRLMGALQTGILLPIYERERSAGLRRTLRHIEREEHLSAEEIQSRQFARLKQLLIHAQETTEYYRKRFQAAGFDPHTMRSADELRCVPPLTRDDIRSNLPNMCSKKYEEKELRVSATGGTTNSPVPFKRDIASLRIKTAVQMRFNAWAGMNPGDKIYRLWGARVDFAENPSWRWRLYDQGLLRNLWAPTSLLNEQVLESYRVQMNQFRPDVVYAYPTPLFLLCQYLASSAKQFHRPGTVICTAEALVDSQRRLIESVMGCKVFEHYGSREFGIIAGECGAGSMHISPPLAFVEYLPVEGGDGTGLREMLVTDLTNYGMPLVRYKINDCVESVDRDPACGCGRSFPKLAKVAGRTSDVFTLPDGSKVPGVALTNRVLQVCPGLVKMQIIQENLREFTIRYVPSAGEESRSLQELRTNLTKFFPSQVVWTFERVTDIERERSGKTRFCISKVGDAGASSSVSAPQGSVG